MRFHSPYLSLDGDELVAGAVTVLQNRSASAESAGVPIGQQDIRAVLFEHDEISGNPLVGSLHTSKKGAREVRNKLVFGTDGVI